MLLRVTSDPLGDLYGPLRDYPGFEFIHEDFRNSDDQEAYEPTIYELGMAGCVVFKTPSEPVLVILFVTLP